MPATILVVEDEALIAADIRRTLQRLGYEVWAPVATGRQALAAARVQRPDLVLMDIKLRGALDGIETARMLRSEHAVPIVYLTSHSDESTLDRAKDTQPYGYLLKPFDDRELRTSIEVALHKHHLETELARRARWFETTLGSLGDAVIATDARARVSFLNAAAEALTGCARAEALGRPLDELVRLVGISGAPLPSPAALAFASPHTIRLPRSTALERADGSRIQVETSAARILDDGDVLLGAAVVLRDVTEREALEQRVAHSERLAAMGALAAGLGHELNTPLAGLLANVELAREALAAVRRAAAGVPAPGALGELADALEDATASGGAARALVDKLRHLALEQLAPVLVEPRRLVEAALARVQDELRDRARVTLALDAAPAITADEPQLATVLVHLLTNAAHAIAAAAPPAGEIRVRTGTTPEGHALIEVADDGVGIPPELLSRIFDPFVTTRPVGAGTGLGLAFAHTVITRLGGEITATSAAGAGACFRITLPPARTVVRSQPIPTHAPAAPAPATAAPPPRARVLVVDDDVVIRRALQRVLGRHHDVEAASDGATAHDLLLSSHYDLVLCDIMMPGMSGCELYEAIRRDRPDQAQRFVFITGGAASDATSQFLERTPNRYLLKPFGADTVRSLAEDVLVRGTALIRAAS